MRRKVASVLAMATFALSVLFTGTAQAGFPQSITACEGNVPACWGVTGVAATTRVHDPSLACNNAQHVESLYIQNQASPTRNFIEFGWIQTRNNLCIHSSKHLFVKGMYHGNYDFSYDDSLALLNQEYRLKVYFVSPGVLGFQAESPPGSGTVYTLPVTYPVNIPNVRTWSVFNGVGYVSMEVNNTTDSCGIRQDNVWIRGSTGVWRAANVGNNAEVFLTANEPPQCSAYINQGSGTAGDDVKYVWIGH